MTPIAKTEDGSYFLDVNPLHFGEILDYLRYGKISTDDPTLIKGIGKLANHFGLTDLAFELECDRDWVILDLERQKKIEISKKSLTRFKSTKLAGFFLGEEEAKIELSHWIKKEAGMLIIRFSVLSVVEFQSEADEILIYWNFIINMIIFYFFRESITIFKCIAKV